MSVKNILFIHGYSETSLGAYFDFPRILSGDGRDYQEVALSAFDSLDDTVSIDDLAFALEDHAANLSSKRNWDFRETAVICHSTGALVARRWMLNRLQAGARDLPSHLVTLAGANHGSTLAQMGKSVLGYLQKALMKHMLSVGKRVLTDLDYGSDFLLRLNREWLEAWNGCGFVGKTFIFSMGGDVLGAPGENEYFNLFWQTSEPGSDNTVRISGANLNYTIFDADLTTSPPSLSPNVITPRVPHLVITGYSHFGAQSGILGNVHTPGDAPMKAVLDALAVTDLVAYGALEASWRAATDTWGNQHPERAYATAVFSLFDNGGAAIDDCFIGILDGKTNASQSSLDALSAASGALAPHQPIHNDVQTASYSFYLRYDEYLKSSPHVLHVEAHSFSPLLKYQVIELMQPPPPPPHLVAANEFTYFRFKLPKDTDGTYAMYQWSPTLNLSGITWDPPSAPFPTGGMITLPLRP